MWNNIKMKSILLLSVFATCISSAEFEQAKIVPKFYEILAQVEKPSEQDEIEFFGGKECASVKKVILSHGDHSKSKTPIWDYVRSNKYFFTTKGLVDLSNARIQYSDPVHMVRLWNKTTTEDMKVYTTFPTEMVDDRGGSSGVSMAIFTLGKNCYLDIGATFVSGSGKLFFEYVYKESNSASPR